MNTFFHGWRRKAGVITLVMACVLCCGWMRSRSKLDTVSIPILNRFHLLASARGELGWLSVDGLGDEVWQWKSEETTEVPVPPWCAEMTLTDVMERLQLGLEVDGIMRGEKNGRKPRLWRISYLPVVLALTLLSASLILWKPRKKPSPN